MAVHQQPLNSATEIFLLSQLFSSVTDKQLHIVWIKRLSFSHWVHVSIIASWTHCKIVWITLEHATYLNGITSAVSVDMRSTWSFLRSVKKAFGTWILMPAAWIRVLQCCFVLIVKGIVCPSVGLFSQHCVLCRCTCCESAHSVLRDLDNSSIAFDKQPG